MTIRQNSLEAAAALISKTTNTVVLLVETSNGGGSTRYKVMKALGDTVVDELHFRDAAITQFPNKLAAYNVIDQVQAAFEDEEGTCFSTRITIFDDSVIPVVIKFGQDYFVEFDD